MLGDAWGNIGFSISMGMVFNSRITLKGNVMEKIFKFEQGVVLRDIVTSFTGVVMVRYEYFTGCIHYGLQNREVNKEGKADDWVYLDESRLEFLDNGVSFIERNKEGKLSGPMPTGPSFG